MRNRLRRRIIAVGGLTLVSAIVMGLLGIAPLEALEVGDRAPDFDLPSTTGTNIKLSQFLGKQAVLIEFYGADFAPV